MRRQVQEEPVTACLPLIQSSGKVVLSCWVAGPRAAKARAAVTSAGIARYATPERAVAAWLQLVAYADNQQTLQQISADALPDFSPDCAGARVPIGHAHSGAGGERTGAAGNTAKSLLHEQ